MSASNLASRSFHAFSRRSSTVRCSTTSSTSCRKISQTSISRANWTAQESRWASSRLHASSVRRAIARSSLQSSRPFSQSSTSRHGHLDTPKPGEERHITFIDKENQSHTFTVADGANLLDIAQAHDLEMEGACGGSCACSTCHVVVEDPDYYDKMAEPDDDENDMLDLAFGLTETSRLGCQVCMSKELDGLVVRLPTMTRNLQASDFVERKKAEG